jgi:predicted permease
MEAFVKDIRFGIRMLFKHPGLSLIIIGTFGLGIGLTTTVFRMVNGALWKGLPVDDAARVVAVERTDLARSANPIGITLHDYADWHDQQTVFEGFALFGDEEITINLSGPEGRPERYRGVVSTANLFDVLAVNPALGRTFREGEDLPGAEPVILIGFEVWRDRYESAADVVGKTVAVNGVRHTIIGVMPEGFAFPDRQQAWLPIEFDPVTTPRGEGPQYIGIARLQDGVTLDEAASQLATIAARLERAYPETNQGIGATVDRFTVRFVGRPFRPLMLTMLGAVIGVLLIACSNVANLLLALVSARVREVGLRTALGASRTRVVRQFFTEVLILAAIGGTLGFGLGQVFMSWLDGLMQLSPPPFWVTFEVDHRVTLFVIGMTTVAALVSGLVPALKASGADVGEALKDEGRGTSSFKLGRMSAGFVVAEVAVSCALLIGAGLMIKSVVRLNTVDLPFVTENIFTARMLLPEVEYPDNASRIQFYERILPQLEAVPGVAAAMLSDGLPGSGNGGRVFEVDGQTYATDDDFPVAREGVVTAGYFRTFEVDVLQGRAFSGGDRENTLPVAVVNQSFARTFFPDGNVIGGRIRMGRRDSTAAWLTVVGVVPDMYMQGIHNLNASPNGFYVPFSQATVGRGVSMALRTRGEPLSLTGDVRAAVAAVDPNLPIFNVFSLKRVMENATWMYRIFGTVFMALGFFALFLASVGLYGVMSFAVSLRTQEIGIRMALGAQWGQLVGLVMRRGVVQLGIGLCLGVCLATLAAGPIGGILYDVSPRDAFVFATVVCALTTVGLMASFFPAVRVTRVDPVEALMVD